MKIEKESLDNKLTKKIEIVKNNSQLNSLEINKIKAEYKAKIQLENQKLLLKYKSLIEENNNLRKKFIEEINKNKLLIKQNNNLNKTIKKILK